MGPRAWVVAALGAAIQGLQATIKQSQLDRFTQRIITLDKRPSG